MTIGILLESGVYIFLPSPLFCQLLLLIRGNWKISPLWFALWKDISSVVVFFNHLKFKGREETCE